MTWAEFLIRLHSYRRQQKNDLYKLRELAWVTYIAPHLNPKRMKKTRDAFWQIGSNKQSHVTDLMRKRITEAQEKYRLEKETLKSN